MGTEVGFAEFVRANTSALLRTAYLLTGNAVRAEELVQDTLTRLYPKWDKVERAEVPLAYVRRSLSNAYINQRRSASRREYAFDVVPDQPDSHDVYTQLADRDEIRTGLQQLPDRQRAALVLRFYEDLDDRDTAAALGCREGTVRSLVSRGLAALRTHLSDRTIEDPPAAGRMS